LAGVRGDWSPKDKRIIRRDLKASSFKTNLEIRVRKSGQGMRNVGGELGDRFLNLGGTSRLRVNKELRQRID